MALRISGAIATRTCFNIDFDSLADPTIFGAAEAALRMSGAIATRTCFNIDFDSLADPTIFGATEVALPHRDGVFEQRAWDAMLFSDDGHTGVELEQRLHDVQAQTRRIMLKWRDSGADRLLLLIANTSHNRAVLETFPEYFVELPALAADDVMAAISRGERPPTGYVLI